jgi:4-hydroxy-tetrahydrodipicolinate synthase
MLITPYYNKPQQHGLVAHYRKVARSVDIPIMLYNVPGRTACNLLPETAEVLAAETGIVAIKEASGNLDQIERAVACSGLQVFSGDDGLNFQIYGLGAEGAVSVVSNLLPGTVVRAWEAWRDGDIATAWKLSRLLAPAVRACFIETSPAPVKELMSLARLCRREPRLPLMPVTEDSVNKLVQYFESTLSQLLASDLEARR